MRNIVLTVVFFILVLSIPYIVDAGVIVKEVYQEPQQDWVDPNQSVNDFGDTYVAQNGLICDNQIYQSLQQGLYIPARKCQLPDGSWAYFAY